MLLGACTQGMTGKGWRMDVRIQWITAESSEGHGGGKGVSTLFPTPPHTGLHLHLHLQEWWQCCPPSTAPSPSCPHAPSASRTLAPHPPTEPHTSLPSPSTPCHHPVQQNTDAHLVGPVQGQARLGVARGHLTPKVWGEECWRGERAEADPQKNVHGHVTRTGGWGGGAGCGGVTPPGGVKL